MPERLNPAVPMLLYLLLAVTLPWFGWPTLTVLAVTIALTGRPSWRLLRRSRWLILMILISYAWSLPGEALVAHDWSPSQEGVMAGLIQVLRLTLLLLCLESWVLRLSPERLLSAILGLLRPFVFLPVERIALRLALALRTLEKPLPLRDVYTWYEVPLPSGEAVRLVRLVWTAFDSIWLIGGLFILAGLLWLA